MEWGTITSTILVVQGFIVIPCVIAQTAMQVDIWRRTRR